MSYVLINRREQGTPSILKRYTTRKGALIGMRASNRNEGWTRISLGRGGIVEMEWCARDNGLPVYNYGPFVIAHEQHYNQRYLSVVE